MEIVIFILKQTLLVCIGVLQLAMLARAIFSWFDPTKESGISAFLFALTEPVILPIRMLFDRFRWFEGFPLDMPFLVTVILLSMVQVLLEVL